MVAAEDVAVILLAAGLSTRFGPSDKLSVPLGDRPLALHAATTLRALPFAARIAVTRRDGPDFAACGFISLVNPNPSAGQANSIRLGVAQARLHAPKAVLIALADMPFIAIAHVEALLARLDEAHSVVGSTDGTRPSPPALFAAALFDTLERLEGDAGARMLLHGATLIAAPPSELADIDTPADLARRNR